MSKICSKCKIEKDEGEFYANQLNVDGLDYYCKDCRKLQSKQSHVRNRSKMTTVTQEHHAETRAFVESLKTDCVKCGEDRPWVIQFHHLDHRTKEFNVASYGTRGRAAIWKEASKCVCLCSNCHDEFHHFFGHNPENPVEDFEKYMNEDF